MWSVNGPLCWEGRRNPHPALQELSSLRGDGVDMFLGVPIINTLKPPETESVHSKSYELPIGAVWRGQSLIYGKFMLWGAWWLGKSLGSYLRTRGTSRPAGASVAGRTLVPIALLWLPTIIVFILEKWKQNSTVSGSTELPPNSDCWILIKEACLKFIPFLTATIHNPKRNIC